MYVYNWSKKTGVDKLHTCYSTLEESIKGNIQVKKYILIKLRPCGNSCVNNWWLTLHNITNLIADLKALMKGWLQKTSLT